MIYRYSGNRLAGLNNMGDEIGYEYDSNGNMTSDGLKNLQIGYNCLNLVQQVHNTSGTELASYRWLADGSKLQVSVPDGSGYVYRGSLIYNSQGLESAGFSEGRIVKTSDGYQLRYHVTDHLGSVRVIFDEHGQVIEQSDYYPFGGRHSDAGHLLADNRYQFNGKEVQSTGGLDFLDYGARMYDPDVARWFNPDPEAERFYATSPFAYCGANPVSRIDIGGKIWIDAHLRYIYKDGKWTGAATPLHKLLGAELLKTPTGKLAFDHLVNGDVAVVVNFGDLEGGAYGEISYNRSTKEQLILATITLDPEMARDKAAEYDLTIWQAIASTAGHEIRHTMPENFKLLRQTLGLKNQIDYKDMPEEKDAHKFGLQIIFEYQNNIKPTQSNLPQYIFKSSQNENYTFGVFWNDFLAGFFGL